MSNFSFTTDGVRFGLVSDNNTVVKELPVGLYNMCQNNDSIYLERIGDEFTFPYERLSFDDEFISHVVRRHKKINKNMGILLNGAKGTGKTSTAKAIANALGLPVIIITEPMDNMEEFIQKIHNPCCFFFDEFEKMIGGRSYSRYSESLLAVLDGVRSSDVRHVFILTTNELSLDRNYLSRPGRILYLKSYTSLDQGLIDEYVNRYLVRKEYRDEMMTCINSMANKCIDTVKCLVEEVNDMDVSPAKAMMFLNIEVEKYLCRCRLSRIDDALGPVSNLSDEDFMALERLLDEVSSEVRLLSYKMPEELKLNDTLGDMTIVAKHGSLYILRSHLTNEMYICNLHSYGIVKRFYSDLSDEKDSVVEAPF